MFLLRDNSCYFCVSAAQNDSLNKCFHYSGNTKTYYKCSSDVGKGENNSACPRRIKRFSI